MKCNLNTLNIKLLTQQVGGLVVKELNSILKVQGSNFINNMCCGQHWNINWIFHTYLNYLGYTSRLGGLLTYLN
jgi:hypothetical protein